MSVSRIVPCFKKSCFFQLMSSRQLKVHSVTCQRTQSLSLELNMLKLKLGVKYTFRDNITMDVHADIPHKLPFSNYLSIVSLAFSYLSCRSISTVRAGEKKKNPNPLSHSNIKD